MTDEEIKKHIWDTVEKGQKAFVYTTVDGRGYPRGRYMGALMIKDGVMYMASFSEARKVKQIKANPHSELIFATEGYKQVATLGGESRIEESLELKRVFWEANPSCKDYFSGYDAAEFGLIAFSPRSGEYLDLELQHVPFAVALP
ncbi:MAG: pyridoxamine 5'-phosphate oxidase family protein [Phycisphaerae bacterium]|nr:pyridoxamine 5'-phosphate oxidase family protein [Phycisphaerae bacterium]